MNFWHFLKNLFRRKRKDNPFYDVCEDHEQVSQKLEEWKKQEIMRSLQAPKSAEEFKREYNAETFGMQIIYDSEGNAHYFPKYAHNCRVFKIIRNQNITSRQNITRRRTEK